jgi:signal transduction histidine kinase
MGRLFWKFFISFWLAQVITVGLVGVSLLVMQDDKPGRPGMIDPAPPPPQHPPEAGRAHAPPPAPPPARAVLPLLPVLAGALISLLFAALLAAYFARPIRVLRSGFAAVADGQLELRIGPSMAHRHDELGDLGQHFDHMANRLQLLIGAQQRLMHDVSHELRSPLARLQAAIELLEQQPSRGPELSARLQRDIGRMDVLVGELLTLARLDSGTSVQREEEIDLAEVVADIVEDAQLEADARDCTLRVSINQPMPIRGNHELLHRALENVVRNALRHSPEHAAIEISGSCQAGRLQLSVADSGPGVFKADLERIFEPFFRSSPASGGSGYGLGLAITRSVISSHGGSVSAQNQPAGGLQINIDLPLAG